MFIRDVKPKIIKDSRGEKTIKVEIKTYKGKFSASAPSGKSKGKHEVPDYNERGINYSLRILKIFAEKIKYRFVDIDTLIEEKSNKSIPEIFKEQGEAYFRRLEQEALFEVAKQKRQVVATGGGIVILEANRLKMTESGIIICLTASVEEICKRLASSTNRPLILVENPKERIKSLLKKRAKWYRVCNHEINTDYMSEEEVALEVFNIVKGKYRILPL